MAELYYYMCTSDEFKSLTGKLINDKKEIMNRGVANPSPLMQIKQVAGTSYYPMYADQKENQDKVWRLCLDVVDGPKLTKDLIFKNKNV
jgi:hypothetical protein